LSAQNWSVLPGDAPPVLEEGAVPPPVEGAVPAPPVSVVGGAVVVPVSVPVVVDGVVPVLVPVVVDGVVVVPVVVLDVLVSVESVFLVVTPLVPVGPPVSAAAEPWSFGIGRSAGGDFTSV
jgi:hypothetical protein